MSEIRDPTWIAKDGLLFPIGYGRTVEKALTDLTVTHCSSHNDDLMLLIGRDKVVLTTIQLRCYSLQFLRGTMPGLHLHFALGPLVAEGAKRELMDWAISTYGRERYVQESAPAWDGWPPKPPQFLCHSAGVEWILSLWLNEATRYHRFPAHFPSDMRF
jgi:hypothetical protein